MPETDMIWILADGVLDRMNYVGYDIQPLGIVNKDIVRLLWNT